MYMRIKKRNQHKKNYPRRSSSTLDSNRSDLIRHTVAHYVHEFEHSCVTSVWNLHRERGREEERKKERDQIRKIHLIRSVCMLLVIQLKFSRSVFPERDNGCGSPIRFPSGAHTHTHIRTLVKLDLATFFWPGSDLRCFFGRRHCLVFVTINCFVRPILLLG